MGLKDNYGIDMCRIENWVCLSAMVGFNKMCGANILCEEIETYVTVFWIEFTDKKINPIKSNLEIIEHSKFETNQINEKV